jgi:hypothetical protein
MRVQETLVVSLATGRTWERLATQRIWTARWRSVDPRPLRDLIGPDIVAARERFPVARLANLGDS